MKRIPISVFFFQRFQPYSYRKDSCVTLCCILITYPCTCCIFRLTLRILGLKDPESICPEFHWEVGWSRKSVTHFDRGILYMISCYTYILQGPLIRGSSGPTGPNCVPFDQDHLWGHRGVPDVDLWSTRGQSQASQCAGLGEAGRYWFRVCRTRSCWNCRPTSITLSHFS